jgi:hypothetical protein
MIKGDRFLSYIRVGVKDDSQLAAVAISQRLCVVE